MPWQFSGQAAGLLLSVRLARPKLPSADQPRAVESVPVDPKTCGLKILFPA